MEKREKRLLFLALKLNFGKKKQMLNLEIPSETFLVIFQHSERIQSKKTHKVSRF